MKTDINGCSTCPAGTENYEFFQVQMGRKKYDKIQYDYRDVDGTLFSCVAQSLEEARFQKSQWLIEKNQ